MNVGLKILLRRQVITSTTEMQKQLTHYQVQSDPDEHPRIVEVPAQRKQIKKRDKVEGKN